MNLQSKIIDLRKQSGMSQEDMAEKLNVSRQTISRWEVGSSRPDAENLRQLSQLFGVTSDYLLNDDYTSDSDLTLVKNAEEARVKTVKRSQRIFLIFALVFVVASGIFLFIGLNELDVRMVIFTFINCAIAGLFTYLYYKTGKSSDNK